MERAPNFSQGSFICGFALPNRQELKNSVQNLFSLVNEDLEDFIVNWVIFGFQYGRGNFNRLFNNFFYYFLG